MKKEGIGRKRRKERRGRREEDVKDKDKKIAI